MSRQVTGDLVIVIAAWAAVLWTLRRRRASLVADPRAMRSYRLHACAAIFVMVASFAAERVAVHVGGPDVKLSLVGYMGLEDRSRFSRLGRRTLERAVVAPLAHDRLPSFSVGRRRVVSLEDFRVWIERYSDEPAIDVRQLVDKVMARRRVPRPTKNRPRISGAPEARTGTVPGG